MSAFQPIALQLHSLQKRLADFGSFVKFTHSVFALPFALSMLFIIDQYYLITKESVLLILVALVAARSAAMAYNRLIDYDIDRQNPRTANRELPRGVISLKEARIFFIAATAIFILAAALLNPLCLILSPIALVVLLGYSWTKRFTPYSHLVLGASLALAPGGVWVALTGSVDLAPVPLMLAVLTWVAGFDIIYACQDEDFDRAHGLASIPARWGQRRAFFFSHTLHMLSLALLIGNGLIFDLGVIYYCGCALFATGLLRQHLLVGPHRLERLDAAFFTTNGIISVLFALFVAADVYLGSSLLI